MMVIEWEKKKEEEEGKEEKPTTTSKKEEEAEEENINITLFNPVRGTNKHVLSSFKKVPVFFFLLSMPA